MVSPKLYEILNRGWKSTCRVLFGEEVGELAEFDAYLKEYHPKMVHKNSAISGKEVSVATDAYCDDARFISAEEVPSKAPEVSLNDLKDVDSLLRALSEIWCYSGNRALGNTRFVDGSDIVIDSQFVLDSANVEQSQYIYSSYMPRRGSKYLFGGHFLANSEFVVRECAGHTLKRCFESQMIAESSDVYVCSNCRGCQDIFFSFNQRNKRNCIGNMVLPREKYLALKKKLLSEIAQELKERKRFPSVQELAQGSKHLLKPGKIVYEKPDFAPIDRAFASVFKIILKSKPRSFLEYETWLSRHTTKTDEFASPFGNTVMLPHDFLIYANFPRQRTVSFTEAMQLASLQLGENEIQSLAQIKAAVGKIAYLTGEWKDGENRNANRCAIAYYATDAYGGYDVTHSECVAYGSQALDAKYVFGCNRILESEFCINCYNSLYLKRCFECDTCTKCADALFCHNAEALSDAMFCFNVKGKRHVIGNLETGKEKYDTLKAALLEQINSEIAKKKSLGMDIYSIGCHKE